MLARNIIRCMAQVASKFHLSNAVFHKSNLTMVTAGRLLSSSSTNFKIRLYSKEANAGTLPVVDYDYVKKVSSSQNEVMIVDVRESDEIKENGKIPNSVNIPLGSISSSLALSEKEFQQTYNRAKPKDNTEIIFYCMIGKRSGKAQQSALELGYKNAKNYLGSWTDWAAKNQ